MRVLHLTRDFPPRSAGSISTAVRGLVRASVRAGLACAVVSFDGWQPRAQAGALPAPAREGDIDVLRVSSAAGVGAARELARAFEPDVLHVHHDMLWPVAAALRVVLRGRAVLTVHVLQAVLNRLRSVPDILGAPGAEPGPARGRRGDRASADRGRAAGRGRAAVCAGHAARHRAARDRGQPCGAGGGEAAFRSARAVCGSLCRHPRHGRAVRGPAAHCRPRVRSSLRDRGRSAREPQRRGALAAALAGRGAADVQARATFPGWLGPDALSALYTEAAVLLAPSWFATSGQVVLEAMLHGVPIAATAAGALAERLAHERTALLSAPRDVDALVENAVRLLEDRALAARLGAAAAAEARRYTWDAVLPALVRVYETA